MLLLSIAENQLIYDVAVVGGGLAVLSGNLAPGGALIKRSAASEKLMVHEGRAVVFDGLEDMTARLDSEDLDVAADDVLVLRDAAVGGAGITLLLPAVAAADVAAGRLCPVLPEHRAEGAALYLLTAGGTLPAKTRALRDAILEAWRPRSRGGTPGVADIQAGSGLVRHAASPQGSDGHGGDRTG